VTALWVLGAVVLAVGLGELVLRFVRTPAAARLLLIPWVCVVFAVLYYAAG
jgi:hypothetical protein